MSDIERFNPTSFLANGLASVQMVPEAQGEYVRYTDYLAVLAGAERQREFIERWASAEPWERLAVLGAYNHGTIAGSPDDPHTRMTQARFRAERERDAAVAKCAELQAKLEIAQRFVADSMSGRAWQSRLPLREGGGPR